MTEQEREFEKFTNFWNVIIKAIEDETSGHPNNEQLFRKLYFMNGLLQSASDMLKVFMQEFYPNFTPEIAEKIDLELKILIRQFGANAIQKTREQRNKK